MNDKKYPELWKVARKRAAFKKHLSTYTIVNIMMWLLWLITSPGAFPWPLFVTLGWGIGISSHYLEAYGFSGRGLADREYDKLLKDQEEREFFEKRLYRDPDQDI